MASFSRRQFVHGLSGAAALAALPRSGQAADYPSRPIRLVIPYGAGGSGDQIGRPWVDRMSSLLGPTFVEYIGGAGGAIGTAAVAREEPDGYSLLLGNGSTQVIIPLTSANPAYSVGDFRAIYRLINSALVFAIHPAVPAANLRELIVYAKANPGKLSYGTPGIATGNHLVGESFKQQAGALDIVHVPYRGIAQATNDLVSGQISLVIAVMSIQLQQLAQAGKVRLLAVTTERRLSGAPDVPTAVESGMPDIRYEGWFGLFAPKDTDDAIIDRIAQATRLAMSDTVLLASYRAQGMEPDNDSSPDKFQRIVEATSASLAPVIKSIGLSNL
ncbi:tripartite tricarboxylate transporter substrate binding protein [Bradyrhizobium sp. SSUT18]|uniref:Bug family tripartite tricarboxylate transporter substrate binding protein n=1 Tax=unclassified Bradyrhizobium TaxID=2631580 RepID=UPI002448114F|nr:MULTISPECIES: tripartite tricarboxylate transporter substrate binding protein [unclassified Bradyrhizobium]MDH2357379.1 tripartite tricarboxylate transporter substrate binding protein [Bradyrhizobium sp. SSUT112]MDH2398639.1 tripartite tricarboxylate transporter substrate binding protein [Bradyrhizobium sp. SSUT18]